MGAFSLQWSLLAGSLGRPHTVPSPLLPAWGILHLGGDGVSGRETTHSHLSYDGPAS